MRNKRGLNNILSTDRKTLYIVLSIVMISVLTLTVVYAALSTTLNINGNAEVSAASWDIHLDNVQLNNSSVTSNVPIITDSRTATFSTTLNKPGDFYEFTIDVVNNGGIDAMIDSITKIPELTASQAKYINYIVEYQNGESITTKQLVTKNSFVRLKVKLEFRKDITALDLPVSSETLNLSFTINYVQSDASGINVPNNGKKAIAIVNGDINTIGSEIAIGDEHFYVVSNDGSNVVLLAKYNLYTGNECSSAYSCSWYSDATGIQDSTMIGRPSNGSYPHLGVMNFSHTSYWEDYVDTYPAYVYSDESYLYDIIETYKTYLVNYGVSIVEARAIKAEELESLGCKISSSTCKSAPSWVYTSSYWTGSTDPQDNELILYVYANGAFDGHNYFNNFLIGIRPVIVMSVSQFS